MRTTLDIADDVLLAAKELARRENKSIGQVVSELARKAFTLTNSPASASPRTGQADLVSERLASYGIHPLPSRGGIVSNELIDRLRDEEGI